MDEQASDVLDREALQAFERRLRDRFIELREEIRADLARSEDERYASVAAEVGDAGDDALADLIMDLNLAETNRDIDELQEIRAALKRIDTGTYGMCEDCGEPIARERLEAHPAAVRCLECQERFERTAGTRTPTL
jgi:RNA polymerase-binding protein DksA